MKKSMLKEFFTWFTTIAVAFVIIVLVNTKVFAVTPIMQTSMNNTLFEGQRVYVDKLSYNHASPERGDVIVFYADKVKGSLIDEINVTITERLDMFRGTITNEKLVKRVIGIPGDEIDIRDGFVYVNNEKLEEPYAKGITEKQEIDFPVKVPEGTLFVLGDNRPVSLDSRSFGPVEYSKIDGKVQFRVWPLSKVGKIN